MINNDSFININQSSLKKENSILGSSIVLIYILLSGLSFTVNSDFIHNNTRLIVYIMGFHVSKLNVKQICKKSYFCKLLMFQDKKYFSNIIGPP